MASAHQPEGCRSFKGSLLAGIRGSGRKRRRKGHPLRNPICAGAVIMALPSNLRAYLPTSRTARRRGSWLGVAAMALAGSAVLVNRRATQAERDYPPRGSFATTDGVRLHYVARGAGETVVFLHGNGAMLEDILISGLFDKAA